MNVINIIPHNSKPITKIEVSPNEKYLITYSEEDNSIVGWNVEGANEGQLKNTDTETIKLSDLSKEIEKVDQICVSNDKKLACIFNDRKLLEIFDMNNKNLRQIIFEIPDNLLLDYQKLFKYNLNGTFNSKGMFIVYEDHDKFGNRIKFYCKFFEWLWTRNTYDILENSKFISISKDDKLYLFLNNYIHVWNIHTKDSKRIFVKMENELEMNDIKIFSNEKFVCLRIKDKIIIYLVELEIPIASLNINDDIQLLYNFMNYTDLYPLLLPLTNNISNQLSTGSLPSLSILPNNIHITTKCAFGILQNNVWKIKFNENNTKTNKTCEYLNIHLFSNLYMDTIHKLFQDKSNFKHEKEKLELIQNLIKWEIIIQENKKMELQVFKKINDRKWEPICTKTEDFDLYKSIESVENIQLYMYKVYGFKGLSKFFNKKKNNKNIRLYGIKSLNDNGIILIAKMGLFIYHFNENDQSISLNYYYSFNINSAKAIEKAIGKYKKIFSKSTLPLPNYDSFKLNDDWINYIKENKEVFLKYGVELLRFAIKEHKLKLIDDIYKKCMDYFKEDLKNNRMFLSIITLTMPLLNEYYPDYILRYSLETTMIIDSHIYSEEHHENLHLYSFFQYPQIIKSNSIWPKLDTIRLYKLYKIHPTIFSLLIIISFISLIIRYIWLIYICIGAFVFIILQKDMFDPLYMVYLVIDIISSKILKGIATPTITFMVPYIKFINYPKDYSWVCELLFKPQPSPFVQTINRDIYKTWNGEALIDFKWNVYGKYYYTFIWLMFLTLLGCFTTIATTPQEHFKDNNKKGLLIASIIFGFIHLSFKVRQFFYSPIKWIKNYWNIFGFGTYLAPTIISFCLYNGKDVEIFWISFSCLLLDLRFLLFFRVFELFGIYFAIIIGVAKRISSFLIILFIIIISFAHTFFILLRPRQEYSLEQPTINDDPNNPWNLNTTYNQIENGTTAQSASFVQTPDENTNMFTNYKTALFAMYLFLTGDSSALSNKWAYKESPALDMYIIFFSFLIVIYLMNLFIGLLNNAIEKENNRVSYLVQKAEILAEIELFYMLPNQRRWKDWFPSGAMYYYADVAKTRKKIKELKSEGEWNEDQFPDMKKELLQTVHIKHESE
ncbi:hypothetical protein RhiirA1_466208 [Rhizophagus irregularis]|uniref:Ion transport domain-containing protein n=1 Tax=Rhizophagus irregularis TaxID=588596 RepID=A0A2N0REB8_9GLOM|nr:hypothetical protein RhiirA1_466208 [Rhizophagus irregularis]